MAESQFDPETLQGAIEGFQEFSAKFAELAAVEESLLANTIRFLRRIPTTDKAKKRELNKYFQSSLGSRYSRAERKAAYDELLGTQRNRGTIG